MKFEFLGAVYKIWFQYPVTGLKRETICLIDKENWERTFAAGSSVCAATDQFRKEVGRKMALTRALKAVEFPDFMISDIKRFRTAAWQSYLNRAKTEAKAA